MCTPISVQDTVVQLQRFVSAMATYHENCYEVMKGATIFPLEMDLSQDAFAYKSDIINTGASEDEDDGEIDNTDDIGSDVEPLGDSESTGENLIEMHLTGNVDTLLDLVKGGDLDLTEKAPDTQEKDVFDLISID